MILKNVLKKTGVFVLDVIFPVYCLSCAEEGEWICKECFKKIELLKKQACPICGNESKGGARCFNCRNKSELDGVISAAAYWNPGNRDAEETKNGLVKKAVHVFKYRFVKDLSKLLAELMIGQLKNRQIVKKPALIPFGPDIENDKIIVPVPLHPKRLRWRGFNQAELLAKNLADYFKLPMENSALIRKRNNIPQVEVKDRRERMENIKDAFDCIRPEAVKGKTIILIDDVCTTSATLSECAKVLKKSGAREVWGAVVARG